MLNQIIFLIDTNVDRCIKDNPTSLSNAVCLSCFRLLHFLSSESEKGAPTKISKLHHTKVKWSYKFFNSKNFVSKIDNHRLYDLRLKYFEEFENEVLRRFESSVSDGKVSMSNSNTKAGDNLHLALMQLLADFSWENPDISSPVKGRRHRKASKPSKKNTVILFSRTPKTFPQLKEFGGKQVLDEDIFLDVILPGSLFQQFCEVTRISLNWVDTQHSKYLDEADISAVEIVEKALAKANGSIVSLDSITKHGSIYYSSVDSILDEDIGCEEQEVAKLTQGSLGAKADCNSLLPITSALSSWLKNDAQHSNRNEYPHQTTIIIGEFCIRAICRDVQILQDTTPANRDRSLLSSGGVQPLNGFSFSGQFMAYGLIARQSLKRITVRGSCICEAATDCEGSGKSGVRKDGAFERLIEKLAARNTCLVLTQVNTGHLVLLEPLTVQTGCMSLISQGSSLVLEKQLLAEEHGVASPAKSKNEGTFEQLVQRLVRNVPNNYCTSYDAGPPSLDSTDIVGSFDGRLLDRWQIPGPPKSFQTLISKLNHRVSGLDFLTEQETSMLKQLQKMYKQETKPPCLLSSSTSANTGNVGIEEREDRFEVPFKGRASRVSLSRTEMILSKSRAVVKEQGQEKEGPGMGPDQPDRARPDTGTHITDFNSVEELKLYLTSVYEKICSGESTLDSSVQMIVMVTQHFIKQTGVENVEEQCTSLLQESLLQTGAQLREKYGQREDLPQEHKINEYSAQVLLRMEMMSSLENKDQEEGEGTMTRFGLWASFMRRNVLSQITLCSSHRLIRDDTFRGIVGLLRTVSFISGSDVLNKFMESSLLNNYIHTIPRTLANIYDELMQPLPDALAMLLSPDTSSTGDQSTSMCQCREPDTIGGPPSARTRSHAGSVGPPSSQPGSCLSLSQLDISASRPRGSRKLAHHPSLADFGAKRQIVVQKIVKEKTSKSSKKSKDPHKRSKDKVSKVLFEKKKGGVKLERRQSVAIMQRSCKTPKKTPRKSPRKLLKSPQYGISPRKKLVAETPSHILLSSVLQGREARKRHLSGTAVIEESPVKAFEPALKDTPTKGKRAKALLRRSFYSAGPVKRTKNLSQYFQLADKIAGRQRQPSGQGTEAHKESTRPAKLLSFDTLAHFKSPDKNSSFLLSQLVSSPSPAKATPRKLASHTPSKLLLESPSRNTRARRGALSPAVNLFQSQSTRSKVVSPSNRSRVVSPSNRSQESPSHRSKVNLFQSPSTRSRVVSPSNRSKVASPAVRQLMSPVSRRSPHVLVAESETKESPKSPQSTPVKSPICGVVLSGLDSPSHNTRLSVTKTPTRNSVRAALFSKSPHVNRTQSPGGRFGSPRTLLAKFGSPCKQSTKHGVIDSPSRNVDLFTDRPDQQSVKCGNACKGSLTFDATSNIDSGKDTDNKMNLQKTPSPKCKKIVKTPESFNKWHRRKPRTSPAVPKSHAQNNVLTSQEQSAGNNTACGSAEFVMKQVEGTLRNKRSLIMSPEKSLEPSNKRRKGSENVEPEMSVRFSKKRSFLLSPGKISESPSKRIRLVDNLEKLQRESSVGSLRNESQGFDTTASCNEMSQMSDASLHYFSASNDEVFFSQNSMSVPFAKVNSIDHEIGSKSGYGKKRMLLFSTQGIDSPRNKNLSRVLSGDFPFSDQSDNERSESPIFGSSKKNTYARKKSGMSLLSQKSDGFHNEEMESQHVDSMSPTLIGKSPCNKKYSPNVSAKSLMHLIQSPLLRSPVEGEKCQETGIETKETKAKAGRSRRSLKMQL